MENKYLVHFRCLFSHQATQKEKTFKGKEEKQAPNKRENIRQHKWKTQPFLVLYSLVRSFLLQLWHLLNAAQ